MTAGGWIVLVLLSLGTYYVTAYLIATIGVLPGLATVPPLLLLPPSPFVLQPSALEMLARGFLIGLTAALNFGIWSVVPAAVGVPLDTGLLITGLLAVFPALTARSSSRRSWAGPAGYARCPGSRPRSDCCCS
ncbi:hypothetical protein HH310_09580 [Actinoplanes sp. TBRC 11911]|uniref:hypothetical protein n=1 Tax=Actinoplanes sp. TBRC 11911 TaxID=2729386 RepID=UPI00145DBC10|nr:hypothetical protein [Actinoplanes sp. TBRC 11911]NMO51440.1 hypothetical protein [Actinoplanes sp. TBRC 11911]